MRHTYFALFIVLLGMAGCVSPEERAAAEQRQEQADRAECRRLGFKDGTEGFGNCLLKLREIRAEQRVWKSYYEPMPRFGVDMRERRGY